ncbi:MAG: 16S rRNA (uracil(1498)-N(3))-methyltransferase [Desulfobulbaceae bacterium]
MNLLLFEKSELRDTRLELDGDDRRARHVVEVLRADPGDFLRVGMIDGPMGRGRVIRAARDAVTLEVALEEAGPEPGGITLILALPRPIMLQRILKQATVMGVKNFHLIRSARVQKSYFQSSVLEEDAVRSILLQGLEQTVDTRLPRVAVHPRFRPFVEDVVPGLQGTARLVAHPDGGATLAEIHGSGGPGEDFILAVGPEGGWNDFEVDAFRKQGFLPFSAGSRILHVDTAVLVLLAQLQLLAELSGGENT